LEDADLFFGSTLDNGSWDTAVWRFGSGSGLGAAADFFRFFDPDGLPFVGNNFFRWGTVDSTVSDGATRRYRELIDAIDTTADPEVLAELLVEAEQILADQAVILPLVLSGDVGLGYWPDAIAGVEINPRQGPLWNVDIWRVPTE
jgi:ABC-type transport system substrate-binding protein